MFVSKGYLWTIKSFGLRDGRCISFFCTTKILNNHNDLNIEAKSLVVGGGIEIGIIRQFYLIYSQICTNILDCQASMWHLIIVFISDFIFKKGMLNLQRQNKAIECVLKIWWSLGSIMRHFKVNHIGWTDLYIYNNKEQTNSNKEVVPRNYLGLFEFSYLKKNKKKTVQCIF